MMMYMYYLARVDRGWQGFNLFVYMLSTGYLKKFGANFTDGFRKKTPCRRIRIHQKRVLSDFAVLDKNATRRGRFGGFGLNLGSKLVSKIFRRTTAKSLENPLSPPVIKVRPQTNKQKHKF